MKGDYEYMGRRAYSPEYKEILKNAAMIKDYDDFEKFHEDIWEDQKDLNDIHSRENNTTIFNYYPKAIFSDGERVEIAENDDEERINEIITGDKPIEEFTPDHELLVLVKNTVEKYVLAYDHYHGVVNSNLNHPKEKSTIIDNIVAYRYKPKK